MSHNSTEFPVYEKGIPLRSIVSLLEVPTYNLAKVLWRRLNHLTGDQKHSINGAQQILGKIKDVNVE